MNELVAMLVGLGIFFFDALAMAVMARGLLRAEPSQNKGAWAILGLIRLVFVAFSLYLALILFNLSPVFLVIGALFGLAIVCLWFVVLSRQNFSLFSFVKLR